jgi:hypothetical protein
MSEVTLTPLVMQAFNDEMAKVASVPQALMAHLSRAGTRNAVGAGIGSGFGLGLGAGALVGGAAGGHDAYTAAKERGAGGAGAALSAVGGGLGGAIRGAGKGALLGAAAGGAAGAALPARTFSATRGLQKVDNVAGTLSNFGQRQVHSLTGWKPGGGKRSIERIGAGAAPIRAELRKELGKATRDPSKLQQGMKALSATEGAQRMGLTSIPGYARSVRDNGLLPTAKAGLQSQWAGSGARGKALMVGLPALSLAQAAQAPEGEGSGHGERAGRIIGGAVGGLAAPLSLAGSLAMSAGLERAGGAVGKTVDRARKLKQPEVPQEASRPPATAPGDTGQHVVEHVYGTGFNGGGLE